jgi:predicted nicotinamide N-methyase
MSVQTHTPPLEISLDEYNDLLLQVSDLTEDDACFELLEAARFGEIDVVRALLSTFDKNNNSTILQTTDDSGTTALHKACANGHTSTAKLLIACGAPFVKNQSGNTPLHWAASNGHHDVVALLLEHYKDIDVLERNEFGRSALTEGFGSKSTETAKVLLEHDSASEEKLLVGAKEVDEAQVDDNNDNDAGNLLPNRKVKKAESIVHDFSFLPDSDVICRIRELVIADDPFGDAPVQDTTGLGVWCASLVMARWMADIAPTFQNKTVVELGAGCGVPGLTLAKHDSLQSMLVTDLNPQTVENLRFNVELNNLGHMTSASTIDWDDSSTWPEPVDTIIGSDLIYSKSIVPLLKKVVLGLLPAGGTFYYVAPDTGRDGLDQFLQEIQEEAFVQVSRTTAPPQYHENPLASQDEEDCYLHFTDLASWTYILYEFRKKL